MNKYNIINVLDMIKGIGEENVKQILSDFSCPMNKEIETFVKKSAIEFAHRKLSVTYFIVDDQGRILAIFTLTHKAIMISNEGLSENSRKKIKRFASLDIENNSYMVSSFLIAQLGKNYSIDAKDLPDGNQIMKSAIKVLTEVQREIGGGVVYLECEDKPQLLSFYQNGENGFKVFGERKSNADQTKYIQLFRLF